MNRTTPKFSNTTLAVGGALALGIGYYLYQRNETSKVYQAKEKVGRAGDELKSAGSDLKQAGKESVESAKDKVPKKPDYIYKGIMSVQRY